MLSKRDLQNLTDFEKELGIPEGFFYKLLNDDDWAFVIKIHSLLEVALSHCLSESIKILFNEAFPDLNIELKRYFSLLETSNKETGKLAFLKGLDLPHENYRGFLHHISEMRYRMIHDIRNIKLTIREYYDSLEKQKKSDFRDKMTFTLEHSFTINNRIVNKDEIFMQNMKIAVWYTAFQFIMEMHSFRKLVALHKETVLFEIEKAKRQEEIMGKFMPLFSKIISETTLSANSLQKPTDKNRIENDL